MRIGAHFARPPLTDPQTSRPFCHGWFSSTGTASCREPYHRLAGWRSLVVRIAMQARVVGRSLEGLDWKIIWEKKVVKEGCRGKIRIFGTCYAHTNILPGRGTYIREFLRVDWMVLVASEQIAACVDLRYERTSPAWRGPGTMRWMETRGWTEKDDS